MSRLGRPTLIMILSIPFQLMKNGNCGSEKNADLLIAQIPDFVLCNQYANIGPGIGLDTLHKLDLNYTSLTRQDKCFLHCLMRRWGVFKDAKGTKWDVNKAIAVLDLLERPYLLYIKARAAILHCYSVRERMITIYGCKNAYNFCICLHNHGVSFMALLKVGYEDEVVTITQLPTQDLATSTGSSSAPSDDFPTPSSTTAYSSTPTSSETSSPTPTSSETSSPTPESSETSSPTPASSETSSPTPASSETSSPTPASSEMSSPTPKFPRTSSSISGWVPITITHFQETSTFLQTHLQTPTKRPKKTHRKITSTHPSIVDIDFDQ